ncbi:MULTISPECIES: hypothetical protein [Phnomibacter]|jgi:hypothetical protein|uniref:Uncharacterized protein n=1 Tax=Phnomibacter ginsenosidimutans TaxID=2676868 RepID=A0A6I6GBC4_9BACT|nr:hypothetical protein [Phnomibacter ginsenosidimutans]MCA0383729.1 hypothetical protein [Bacteroidota bacterium]MCC6762341.1 hypothetical protein [Chitinophagaceae bacterium]QGW28983.1 hypothetical protein GLV81_13505 [Phnomibacter ginsenosidimutans]
MIWLILLGSMLLGIMVIRFSYKIEKKRLDKDRAEAAKAMQEFQEMLKQQKEKQ